MIDRLEIEKLLKNTQRKAEKAHLSCKQYRELSMPNSANIAYGRADTYSEISRILKKILKENAAP